MKLIAKRFRVLNYRNIDDSGWIPLERATVFVGRNEAGKTALLKALHKFNPAIKEPYIAQREFPRDRFTGEYQDAKDWPVCRVEFELSDEFRKELGDILNDAAETPQKAILTRFYKGNLKIEYDTEVLEDLVDPGELTEALDVFAKGARRLAAPSEDQEEATRLLRTKLVNWADRKKGAVGKLRDLRSLKGTKLLGKVRREANTHAQPETADLVEVFHKKADELLGRAKTLPISQWLDEAIENALPVFIYFENYGILDSAVYLPRFLEDLKKNPDDPRIRTINAMFKHVQLTAAEIEDLGEEQTALRRAAGQSVTQAMIRREQKRKELRTVKLNSASLDISRKFRKWFGQQRKHKIRQTDNISAYGYRMIEGPMLISSWRAAVRDSNGFSRSTWSFWWNQMGGTRMRSCYSTSRGCTYTRRRSRN